MNNVELAIDPICGMQVDPAKARSMERSGQSFYFCCEGCREKFASWPDAKVDDYLNAPMQQHSESMSGCCHGSENSVDLSTVQAAYYCPMCPAQESDSPGFCAKCGMALEPNPVHEIWSEREDKPSIGQTMRLVVVCSLATVVLLLAMLPMMFATTASHAGHSTPNPSGLAYISDWVQAILTATVLAFGWSYWKSGWDGLRRGSANMFTLVGIGAWSAFLLSLFALMLPGAFPDQWKSHGHVPLYFESAAVIVALVMLGQQIETNARAKTSSALKEMIALLPRVAYRMEDGVVVEVDQSELKVDDEVLIQPGQSVPADGIVTRGESEVEQSLITGESLPVTKRVGDSVIGGAVNRSGVLQITVKAVGPGMRLGKIVNQVAIAQRSRAPIQDQIDRFTAYFVPAVVAIAAVAGLAWLVFGPTPSIPMAFLASISVLVIACPCALGLAAPMSIVVGIGKAAKQGVLIRDAKAFQQLIDVNHVVFDKTGTLTEGRPNVIAFRRETDRYNDDQLLAWIASVEQLSEHPYANAIVKYAKDRHVSVQSASGVSSTPGKGMEGIVEGRRVRVGTRAWTIEPPATNLVQISLPSKMKNPPIDEGKENRERSLICVSVDGSAVATFECADQLRSTSRGVIQELKHLGIMPHLLSGDRKSVVESVAKELAIESWQAEVSPEQKRAFVQVLKRDGAIVAMIGDGINDAPALAEASVGIALGSGTDVANQTAAVTLMGGDIQRLIDARDLSRAVVKNIRENLILGLSYNVIAIPIAAGALYPWTGWLLSPMLAALAMSLSSITVVGNALRLMGVSKM